MEDAGNQNYQNDHMGKIFSEGFSFSGFERDKLYLSESGKHFVDVSGVSGVDAVGDGRGAAYGDFDNDGDLDIFLTSLQGQVHHLFRNNVGQGHGAVRIALEGRESGRDAFGTEVRLKTAQGVLTKIKAGGSGYVSQSDPRLLFGLGAGEQAEWLEVRWPSGRRQRFAAVPAGASLKLVEGNEALEYVEEQVFALPEPAAGEAVFHAALKRGPGDVFPAVKMIDAQGRQSDFHAYRRPGSKYLINFWATYCVPCRREMPELQQLSKELQAAGVEVIGISLDMGAAGDKVPSFLARMGITYANFTTDASTFDRVFAGEQIFIPLSFIVDGQGRINDVFTGWSPATEKRLRQLIGETGNHER